MAGIIRHNSLDMEYDEDRVQNLVERARGGEHQAITALFELLSDRIFRYIRLRVSEKETAEDLTQTVFVEMLQSLRRYKGRTDAKFSTWLFQIARFRLIDHYRRQRPLQSIDETPESAHPGMVVDPEELPHTDDRVDAALRQLPEKWQTLLHLRFREDLTTREISRVLRTSELNVRVMQHRALRALRALLNEERKL